MRERMIMSNSICVDVFATNYTAMHSFAMRQPNIPVLLRKMMEAMAGPNGKPATQTQLAAKISSRRQRGQKAADQSYISRWLREKQVPEHPYRDWIFDTAAELGVISENVSSEDVAATLPEAARKRTVKLKGYVGAGAEAHYYSLADEDFEEVAAPMTVNDQTVAVEIKGTSLGPFFEAWLVYYDDVRSPVTPDMAGRLCVVGLSDDRILIKRLERNGRGGYDLISNSNSEPRIENAPIEWAACVTDMKPRL